MKKTSGISMLWMLALCASLGIDACKNKAKDNTPVNTTNVDSNSANKPAAVEVPADNTLQTGVNDAIKDYPDVKASVDDGVVTLTGTIERDRLPRLMEAIHGLSPRKVNNQTTIK